MWERQLTVCEGIALSVVGIAVDGRGESADENEVV